MKNKIIKKSLNDQELSWNEREQLQYEEAS